MFLWNVCCCRRSGNFSSLATDFSGTYTVPVDGINSPFPEVWVTVGEFRTEDATICSPRQLLHTSKNGSVARFRITRPVAVSVFTAPQNPFSRCQYCALATWLSGACQSRIRSAHINPARKEKRYGKGRSEVLPMLNSVMCSGSGLPANSRHKLLYCFNRIASWSGYARTLFNAVCLSSLPIVGP